MQLMWFAGCRIHYSFNVRMQTMVCVFRCDVRLHMAVIAGMNNSKGAMAPPSRTNLARARRKRMHDKRMWSAIREIAMYIFFLSIVSFIAWGTKNDMFFMMNSSILNLYNGGNGTYKSKWVSISNCYSFACYIYTSGVPVEGNNHCVWFVWNIE